jgi:hypothetical protein
MPAQLILEFDGVGTAEYEAVNAVLGVDPVSGEGDWPEGLISHAAGWRDDGRFFVVEVWSSVEAQEKFMNERLGAALAEGGVKEPSSVNWVNLHSHHHRGG